MSVLCLLPVPATAPSPVTEIITAVSNHWILSCTGPSAQKPCPNSLSHLTPTHPSRCGLDSSSSRKSTFPYPQLGGMRLASPPFPFSTALSTLYYNSLFTCLPPAPGLNFWKTDSVLLGLVSTAPLTEPGRQQVFTTFFCCCNENRYSHTLYILQDILAFSEPICVHTHTLLLPP